MNYLIGYVVLCWIFGTYKVLKHGKEWRESDSEAAGNLTGMKYDVAVFCAGVTFVVLFPLYFASRFIKTIFAVIKITLS